MKCNNVKCYSLDKTERLGHRLYYTILFKYKLFGCRVTATDCLLVRSSKSVTYKTILKQT